MPSTIRCATCGFENTTTSLYCQDCGVRLVAPPSAISEEAAAAEQPPAGGASKTKIKPRILSEERPNRLRSYLVITLRTLILAALAALIVQILRPPANVAAASPPLAPEIVANIRTGLQQNAATGRSVSAPWASLNSYLAAALAPAPTSGSWQVSFVRAQVAPTAEGGFALFQERKLAGIRFYSTIDYRVVARGNGIDIVPTKTSIGQLPLPGWATAVIGPESSGMKEALAPDLAILREAKNLHLTPQKVVVDFGPSRP